MVNNVLEPRYKDITPEIISSTKSESHLLKQPELLFRQEIKKLDDVAELKGGKINTVCKGSMEGVKQVIKISFGLYRKTELKREAEALKILGELGGQHLVPKLIDYNDSGEYACLFMEYIEGVTVREKLVQCRDKQERAQIWVGVGKTLSYIHSIYQKVDLKESWLDRQIEIAEMNMKNGLLDPDEFEDEPPEEVLVWLKANKPVRNQLSLVHGDFRTKNIIITEKDYKVIDWGFVDTGDPYYDLAVIDYYFMDKYERDSFYKGYGALEYNRTIIEYYDKLSGFINV